MKKITLALIITFCFQGFAYGEQKIAIINLQRILDEAVVAKNIAEQLSKKRDEFQVDVEKKEQDLGKLNQDLTKQQSILSKEAFEVKVRDFNNKLADVQREFQTKRNIIEQSQIDAMSKMEDAITSIIENLAKEKSLSIVLPANSTSYYNNDLDITSEILTLLNKKLQKIEVTFENPSPESPSKNKVTK